MAVNIENYPNLSEILRLKCEIKRSERNEEPINEQVFVILAVERFTVDPAFQSYVKSDESQKNRYSHDITLTDGQFKSKCVLSPTFNRRVQRGEILPGSVVKLLSCSLLYDESDLDGLNFILIKSLEVLHVGENVHGIYNVDVEQVEWCPNSCSREQKDVPLASKRGCYVSLWSPFETYGKIWEQQVDVLESVSDDAVSELYTLKELSRHWRSLKLSSYPPLLVRVLTKSRVRHYAKPGKVDKWPFQVSMVIGDRSGSCTAVIWNSLCAKLYNNIHPGTVLLLENYTVKQHFNVYAYQPKSKVNETAHYDIDVNLNPHHPVAKVSIVDSTAVDEDWQLPPLDFEFVSRRQLGSVPDNFVCDVVGVVRYLGRYERLRVAPLNTDQLPSSNDGACWVIRWVELIDHTFQVTAKTFLLKLFRSIQVETVDALFPGQILSCSHMRVVQSQRADSRQATSVYLTSTGETQISVIQGTDATDWNSPIIDELTSWAVSDEGKQAIKDSKIGGYFSYPPLPCNLAHYKQFFTDANPMQIVVSDQWEAVLQSLSFRESRTVLIQASIVRVAHHSQNSPPNRNKAKRKRRADDGVKFREVLKFDAGLDSLRNVTVLGSTVMEADSLGYRCSRGQEDLVLEKIAFPASVYVGKGAHLRRKSDLLQAVDPGLSYLSVVMRGLNHPVAIQAIQLHPNLPPVFSLPDALSKRPGAQPTPNTNSSEGAGMAERWLCHLDLYQIDADRTEIILNTAYPLG